MGLKSKGRKHSVGVSAHKRRHQPDFERRLDTSFFLEKDGGLHARRYPECGGARHTYYHSNISENSLLDKQITAISLILPENF